MPNCFQLTKKGEQEATPLNTIDRELCALLGVEEHPKLYAGHWFDHIGFKLALGKTFEQIKADITHDMALHHEDRKYYRDMLKMAEYLDEHYTANAWVEIGKRREPEAVGAAAMQRAESEALQRESEEIGDAEASTP